MNSCICLLFFFAVEMDGWIDSSLCLHISLHCAGKMSWVGRAAAYDGKQTGPRLKISPSSANGVNVGESASKSSFPHLCNVGQGLGRGEVRASDGTSLWKWRGRLGSLGSDFEKGASMQPAC